MSVDATTSPPRAVPSDLTAVIPAAVGEVAMTERTVQVGGRLVRVGNADDAGRLCRTPKRPEGYDGREYRWQVRRNGAPSPVQVPDPFPPTGQTPTLVDLLIDGRPQFDLDAVEEWNAARPGSGGWRNAAVTAETLPRTETREWLLVAARDGRMTLDLPHRRDRPGVARVDGEQLDSRTAQSRGHMRDLGLLVDPAPDAETRQVLLPEAGRAALTRWGGANRPPTG